MADLALLTFGEEHRDAVGRLHAEVFPEYAHEEAAWHPGRQLDDPALATTAFVATADSVAGYTAARPSGERRYRLNLMVSPRRQGEGIGRRLLSRIEAALREEGAISIQARVRADKPAALRFARQNGYEEVHRMVGMSLDLARVDRGRLDALVRAPAPSGIAYASLAAVQRGDSGWLPRLHALHVSVLPAWPSDDPTRPSSPPPEPEFARWIEGEGGPADDFLVAEAGPAIVGYCSRLGTAVAPAWRKRGIARGLKARFVERAIARGQTQLFSASANPVIVALNRQLGYAEGHTEVRLIKTDLLDPKTAA